MNDIAKQNVKHRLEGALIKENLSTNEAAALIGVKPPYLSMIKNPKTWGGIPPTAWDEVLAWVNSGQSIKRYGESHGRELIERPDIKDMAAAVVKKTGGDIKEAMPAPTNSILETRIPVTKEEVIVPKRVVSVPKCPDFVPKEKPDEPIINVKPGVLKKRQKEIEHKRMSNGELIDALVKERALLREKIDAIDVLLKHYIS